MHAPCSNPHFTTSYGRPALFYSAVFQFAAVKDRQEEVEVMVSRSGVRMLFPLWKAPESEGGEEGGGERESLVDGPAFVYGRVGIKLRLEWTQIDEKRPGKGE